MIDDVSSESHFLKTRVGRYVIEMEMAWWKLSNYVCSVSAIKDFRTVQVDFLPQPYKISARGLPSLPRRTDY